MMRLLGEGNLFIAKPEPLTDLLSGIDSPQGERELVVFAIFTSTSIMPPK